MKSVWILVFAVLIFQQMKLKAQFLEPDCGTTINLPATTRIVGGRDAEIGSSPWLAYLHINSFLICAGTLITRRFVLTAAHCMDQAHMLTVRLGEHDISTKWDCTMYICMPPYEEYEVEYGYRHYLFDKNIGQSYDIGLLKLKGTVEFKVHIRPICLIKNPNQVRHSATYEATGWGKTDLINSATTLQTVTLIKLNPSECERSLRTSLGWGQICAGKRRADTCSGDSGGPLVHRMSNGQIIRTIQFGIVSYGNKLCRGPGVYTDVLNFTNWIVDVTRWASYS
ncbi:chymotrypsin-like protease CTRL-1 [Drosophila eugracilis]|uniref:chymotrypsin-like protease CTRL-1 n=1 Tax=Drosophila eugracilis TaxID=29029 RepID=UPI0007E7896E|nr:chymotrypsin-like protease CTRL-1 [Drosophila eugracilis]